MAEDDMVSVIDDEFGQTLGHNDGQMGGVLVVHGVVKCWTRLSD